MIENHNNDEEITFFKTAENSAMSGVLTDDPRAEGGEYGEECEDEDGGHEGDSTYRGPKNLSPLR